MKNSNEKEELKYRIPLIYIFILVILIVIAIWIVGTFSGLIPIYDLLLNFVGFISMLISITMLAVVGAIFLGMYLSHRILSKKGFTPFEISMLEMHEDVKDLKDRIIELEKKLVENKGK